MKKIALFGMLAMMGLTQAQIAVTRHNNTPVASGQVIAFNSTQYPQGSLDFFVKNLSTTASVNVRINCTSLVNTNGEGFELCFANECLSSVEEGMNYPVNLPFLTLPPGGQSGNDGHFYNTVLGSAPYPKDFSFRFFQAGNPSGNFVDVTYRFDPALSVSDIEQLQQNGVLIKATTFTSELTLDVLKASQVQVFDVNGKSVLQRDLPYGIHTLDTSAWQTGMYILQFTDAYGNVGTKKVIKN